MQAQLKAKSAPAMSPGSADFCCTNFAQILHILCTYLVHQILSRKTDPLNPLFPIQIHLARRTDS